MATFDWSKRDVERAVNAALEKGHPQVALSMDFNSTANEQEVVDYATELGYKAELKCNSVLVTLK